MEPMRSREQNANLASVESMERVTALILAGGESLRMGTAKPFVRWRGMALIEHVLERLRPIFDTVYIVAREPDAFAYLDVPVIPDAGRQRGPLMGLYSGLVGSRADWCLAVGCDMPLISPGLLEHMRGLLGTSDIVAARVGGRVQPLPALYSKRCIPEAERLLGLGTTSLMPLIEDCRTTLLAERELATFDPDLMSFKDVDTPEELARLAAEVSA